MLFSGETRLTAPIKGVEAYASEFGAQGPKDHLGRSLRDLDLTTRMFRYPCSFLIYSAQFDGLPQLARDRVYRRLYDELTGHGQHDILEILRDTKQDLPPYWSAESHR
jgi:hypothetical protein